MIDVDGFNVSAAKVAALHAAGLKVVCYLDVGSCNAITLAELSDSSTGGTTTDTPPASCQAIESACPSFLVPGASGGMHH